MNVTRCETCQAVVETDLIGWHLQWHAEQDDDYMSFEWRDGTE